MQFCLAVHVDNTATRLSVLALYTTMLHAERTTTKYQQVGGCDRRHIISAETNVTSQRGRSTVTVADVNLPVAVDLPVAELIKLKVLCCP